MRSGNSVVGVIFLLEVCLLLGGSVRSGCFHTGLSICTGLAMEPEILLVVDRGISMFAEVVDARLSTSNCGAKKKMGCSEGEIMLMIMGEGEAKRGCGAVSGKFQVVHKAVERFFVLTVKVPCGGWEAHGMTEFLACKGLATVAEGTV